MCAKTLLKGFTQVVNHIPPFNSGATLYVGDRRTFPCTLTISIQESPPSGRAVGSYKCHLTT